ncbi:ArsR/SmtB family transcription factor [Aureibacter tunicatorum]|uniref:DNA-binding transcriptional ArsR family regulator n=1 Tax=Aureibacter tunicatorum TaxID=866807 RepID=A0AAE3XK87_9BACT|nr:metalloregulator ArsR/SmtB family transcription factor [Aureibacter tunicatorum]MDR6239331.1 DNA-binding transcriptional ArsR family regulator [Aureibacter tunicatorum]BDD04746.1 hypothetical protein AUTU_22290 [Aureibacter tunicatorum]
MELKRLAKIMKALSNENRLELFFKIAESEESSFDSQGKCGCFIQTISDKLHIGAPTVSHHLKELVNADLIQTQKSGKQVLASVNKSTLAEVKKMLEI